jgi:hypothetical protein
MNEDQTRLSHASAIGGADSQTASAQTASQPLPESGRRRVWSLGHAEIVVRLELETTPVLREQLAILCGGFPGLVVPIIESVIDAVSYGDDNEVALTGETFRQLSGAPTDDSQLDVWRQNLYQEYKARHTAAANPQ